MRQLIALAVLAVLAACGPRGSSTLPEPPPRALSEIPPRLTAGEQISWSVFYQSVPIGRAELITDDRAARTTFRTSRAARILASARFELATAIERGRVRGVRESLTLGRTTERAEASVDGSSYTPEGGEPRRVPGGTRLHTLHSALGVVRTWSADRAPTPGYLWVWSGGELYRVDLSRPVRDDVLGLRALRVDGTIRAPHLGDTMSISLWLAANKDRTPIRLLLRSGPHLVAAEVHESTASLEAR